MAKIREFAALILSVVIFTASAGVLKAQSNFYEEEPRTFYGGLLAGVNFTQVDGDSYAGYHKVGFNFGGIAYANLGEHVAASMEILFSQKGSRKNLVKQAGSGAIITDYKLDLNYAEVPIMINYFDKRKSHFGGGFSYSQLVNSKEVIATMPASAAYDPLKYPFKKMDINFLLSGNLHLWKGFFLNLRFQYSIIPIRKNIPAGFGRAEQYNNMFVVRLMYLFI